MKSFGLTKRQKIIISTILVFLGFLFTTQGSNILYRYQYAIVLVMMSYLLSVWALSEGMTKLKAVILLILPTLYIFSITSFYFLFREIRWLTRIPAGIFLGASFYLLLLTQNVFNIASIRNIPLYRAATSSSFIFTILTSLLLYSVIFALNLPFYWNGLAMAFLSFILLLQMFWTIDMNQISSQILIYAMVIGLLIGEVALALSFWPAQPFVKALIMSPFLYSMGGISNEQLRNKISRGVVVEYLIAGSLLFLVIFFITTINSVFL